MDLVDTVGTIAAILTTSSFLPQVIHTFRSKDARGISLGMYMVFITGVSCWLIYGLLLRAWPIVVANAITISFAMAILVMKLRYR